MPNLLPVFPVESAQGVHIQLMDGRSLIDGISSWWTCIHGYNHPQLNQGSPDGILNSHPLSQLPQLVDLFAPEIASCICSCNQI
jgi:glutamate-1-semialdehyde aminotransferase